MKKINAVIILVALTVVGQSSAFAESNPAAELSVVNAKLTTDLEQFAVDKSICETVDFKSMSQEVNSAVEAAIASGAPEIAFDAQEAGKGLELLEKHCGVAT